MNVTAFGIAARAVGLALILALAAAFGVVAGNLMQGRADSNAGYPDGWQGGAAAPVTRTANSAFSLDAISAVQAARGDAVADTEDYADYGLRHAKADAGATYVDYVDQAKQRSAAIEQVAAPEASKDGTAKPTPR